LGKNIWNAQQFKDNWKDAKIGQHYAGVSAKSVPYQQLLADTLKKKLKAHFMKKAQPTEGLHTVMIFGRTATGKTFFWNNFLSFLASKKCLYGSDMVNFWKTVDIKHVETTGYYPEEKTLDKGFHVYYKVQHSDKMSTFEYSKYKESGGQYEDKENILTALKGQFKDGTWGRARYKNYIHDNFANLKYNPTIDESNDERQMLYYVLRDNRLEIIRPIRYKNEGKEGHPSTRNHIKKEIHFKRGKRTFIMMFFIWAGAENIEKNYLDSSHKDRIMGESKYFNTTNEAFISFVKSPETSFFLAAQKKRKNIDDRFNKYWKEGNMSIVFAVYPSYKKHLEEFYGSTLPENMKSKFRNETTGLAEIRNALVKMVTKNGKSMKLFEALDIEEGPLLEEEVETEGEAVYTKRSNDYVRKLQQETLPLQRRRRLDYIADTALKLKFSDELLRSKIVLRKSLIQALVML